MSYVNTSSDDGPYMEPHSSLDSSDSSVEMVDQGRRKQKKEMKKKHEQDCISSFLPSLTSEWTLMCLDTRGITYAP